MKKYIFAILFVVLSSVAANAQFTHYGVRLGFGPATISDDMLTQSPILGVNLGGYLDYGFTEAHSFFADNLFLRLGLNFTRRGSDFVQEWIPMSSIRTGFYHAWYAQIPIQAAWRYELPLPTAGHIVNFFFGPAVSVGMFGRLWDRWVTPGLPQSTLNYDTYVTTPKDARRVFNTLRRIDVSSTIGIGYQFRNYTVDLIWDHGFIPLKKESDILNELDRQTAQENGTTVPRERNGYTGTHNAIILSIGYQMPMPKKM